MRCLQHIAERSSLPIRFFRSFLLFSFVISFYSIRAVMQCIIANSVATFGFGNRSRMVNLMNNFPGAHFSHNWTEANGGREILTSRSPVRNWLPKNGKLPVQPELTFARRAQKNRLSSASRCSGILAKHWNRNYIFAFSNVRSADSSRRFALFFNFIVAVRRPFRRDRGYSGRASLVWHFSSSRPFSRLRSVLVAGPRRAYVRCVSKAAPEDERPKGEAAQQCRIERKQASEST